MIISRSPLRITLGGGGTDLPSYYKKKGGFLISAAINKYVYVTVLRPFKKGIFLKYSKIENVKKILKVHHPIVREALKLQKLKKPQIEIFGEPPSPVDPSPGCRFASRCSLAEERCRVETPLLRQIKSNQKVACHLV